MPTNDQKPLTLESKAINMGVPGTGEEFWVVSSAVGADIEVSGSLNYEPGAEIPIAIAFALTSSTGGPAPASQSVTTTEDGCWTYPFSDVKYGTYRITATSPNHTNGVISNIIVHDQEKRVAMKSDPSDDGTRDAGVQLRLIVEDDLPFSDVRYVIVSLERATDKSLVAVKVDRKVVGRHWRVSFHFIPHGKYYWNAIAIRNGDNPPFHRRRRIDVS